MNDRDELVFVRDHINAHLIGGSSGGGGSSGAAVAAVTVKPSPFDDRGTGNQAKPAEIQVSPGQVVGVAFTVLASATNERIIKWFGAPGQFWQRMSWCVFDSGGGRAMFADDVAAGALQSAIDLRSLGAGSYTLGVAVDGSGNLAFDWRQN